MRGNRTQQFGKLSRPVSRRSVVRGAGVATMATMATTLGT